MLFIKRICQFGNTMITRIYHNLSEFLIKIWFGNHCIAPIMSAVDNNNSGLMEHTKYSYKGWELHNNKGLYYAIKSDKRIVSKGNDFEQLESIIDFEESYH